MRTPRLPRPRSAELANPPRSPQPPEVPAARVLVCGSRDWPAYGQRFIADRLGALIPHGALVITGGARGVDQFAHRMATRLGHPTLVMPADWDRHGRRAGYVRNIAMLDQYPDRVLAFQSANSRGTQHTIDAARSRGIDTRVFTDADLSHIPASHRAPAPMPPQRGL